MLLVLTVICVAFLSPPARPQQGAAPADLASGSHLVLLLDTNPHQEKVLAIELSLAESVVQRLDEPTNTFSVIAFGSEPPIPLKSGVTASEVIPAIRSVTLEQRSEKYFSVHFYDALKMAIDQFSDDARSKSLLIISEGNDHFQRSTFGETVSRSKQLRLACDVAMVADHTFYGTKGIQRYGFELRDLAEKPMASTSKSAENKRRFLARQRGLLKAFRLGNGFQSKPPPGK